MAKLESVVKYVFIIEFFPSQIDVSETRAFAVWLKTPMRR